MNILEFLKNGSGIHIKKKNRGKFTKSAKAAGQSVQEHAKSVLNDPNATTLQKKRANFARNAAKWHHKQGGILYQLGGKTKEDVDYINNQNKSLAEGLFKGIFSGEVIPTIPNVGRMIGAAYKGWISPETTYITGVAPTPSGIKNPNKVVKSVADINDKGLKITKKLNTSVKNEATYLTGDKRFINSGRNKITKQQRDRAFYMINNYYLKTDWGKQLVQLIKKQTRAEAKGLNYKKYNKDINNLLDDFIYNSGYFKQGGIIKAEEGTKISWWNKIGKALNSDLAQGIISGVGNYALYNQQNKMLNAQVDAQNAQNETDYLSSWLDRYKLNLSQQNNKSNIVNQYNAYNMTPYNPPNKINYKASTPSWLNGLNIIGNSVIANKKPNTV